MDANGKRKTNAFVVDFGFVLVLFWFCFALLFIVVVCFVAIRLLALVPIH